MDQCLIGPGVVERRGHVHVTICQDEQRPLKTEENKQMYINKYRGLTPNGRALHHGKGSFTTPHSVSVFSLLRV